LVCQGRQQGTARLSSPLFFLRLRWFNPLRASSLNHCKWI
jgi:hypothetical protein